MFRQGYAIKFKKFISGSAVVFILTIALLCIGCSADTDGNPYKNTADPYDTVKYDSGWEIEKADIRIQVNKDKTARVTENYVVDFFDASYAFDRYLPITNGERYLSLTASASVDKDVQHTRIYEEMNYIVLSVEFDRRMTGRVSYSLSYDVIPKIGERDVFYMNVIGQGWTTAQKNISVTLSLPFEISPDSKIYYGSWGSDAVLDTFTISGNEVYITKDELPYGNGITAVLIPRNGKFDMRFDIFDFSVFLISAAALVALICIFIVKRQHRVNSVVNFYPPKDENDKELTPVDMGVLIDRVCDDEDITAMIFYWASKGAISISDEDGICLKKIGELPENAKEYEKLMFGALFKNGKKITVEQLKKDFYITAATVKMRATSQYADIYNDKKTSRLSLISLIVAEVTAFVCIIVGRLHITREFNSDVFFTFRFVSGCVFAVLGIVLIYSLTKKTVSMKYKRSVKKTYLYSGLIAVLAVLLSVALAMFSLRSAAIGYAEAQALSALVFLSPFICGFIMRHSDKYTRYLEQILGFKEFLIVAEKDRLEMLLEENPEYYYDILPYANLLGVSDIWQEKFKDISVSPPVYYSSTDTVFDILIFNTFYRNTFRGFSRDAIAVPRSVNSVGRGGFSGGGFSGGGFSGGGFGGGGGGRR